MIALENVCYTYTPGGPYETTALDGVSLSIEKGDFVGLIGHTGSGKSTLVQIICGLLKPTSGRAVVDGVDLTQEKAVSKALKGRVGMVFQYPEHQLFEETVAKDIAFGPSNMGLSPEEIQQRVQEAASYVHLSKEMMEKSPFDLSGGQKRRVAIAGVLAMHPSVLILDEPTAGLDPIGRDKLLSQIKSLHERWNTTIVLVSHSMEDIAKTVDKVLVMDKGKLAMQGSIREVFVRGEELKQMGLNIPQITSIMQSLARKGYPVREDIFTVEEAKEEILTLLKGGKLQ